MIDTSILIHIGFPKTGSTTLQNAFFDKHSDIGYIGQSKFQTDKLGNEVLKRILATDEKRFLHSITKIQNDVRSRGNGKKAIVISDEQLSCGEYSLRPVHWQITVLSDHYLMAKRLCNIFSNAKILMVCREQVNILESAYLQGLKVGRINVTPHNWIRSLFRNVEYRSFLNLLKYDEAYEAYAAMYGENKVLVYPYEKVQQNWSSFIEELANILGIDVEVAISLTKDERYNTKFVPTFGSLLKRGNLRRKYTLIQLIYNRWLNKGSLFDEGVKNDLRDFFRESNRRFATTLKEDLALYGYAL